MSLKQDNTLSTPQTEGTFKYFVDGMDCASCVQKVEKMVSHLPGTGEVTTSFARQTLELRLDEAQTPRTTLERNLRALGYVPTLEQGSEAAQAQKPPTAVQVQPWYRSAQGKLVIFSGLLLLMAYLFGFFEPQLAVYGYIAATVIGVWPLAKKAVVAARLGDPFSINTLVSLAAIGAVLIGEAAEGAVVVFFFAVGELLEGVAAGRARAGIQALAALTPKTALLLEGGVTKEVSAATLQIGQMIQINPGARVPADGVIASGQSSLDDSPVTGESMPVGKTVGDNVFAGSINVDGVLSVEVSKASSDNTIARIIKMVEEAEASKSPTARFIDRFSRWYTPAVVLVSALVAVIPPLLMGQAWSPWIYKGISLLLIGCPCALVLSVPAAITSAIAAGTRRGLLIKGGAALEAIGQVKTIAFDKTGTLTAGHPKVTDMAGNNSAEILRLAAAVEAGSSHPLAKAIVQAAREKGLALPMAAEAKALSGKGVSAQVEGRLWSVSSPKYAAQHVTLSEEFQQAILEFEKGGKTAVVLHDQQQALGVIAIRDEPRLDAKKAIETLNQMGIQTVMLTGDNARTGQAVASALGLSVQAELLPEDKLRVIDQLKSQGGVAMVGDGINDAPALARATVGLAMGGGTDVALETADAALLRERVMGVVDLVDLSRKTLLNIKWNITFAIGLKAVFLVTTLLGYTNLWMAILADTGATVLVTANALRLLRYRGIEGKDAGQVQSINQASPS